MSVGGLFAGTHTFLVGLEDQADGGLRLYLKHRSLGLYSVIYDEAAKDDVRRAWDGGGHVTVPVPPVGCVYRDEVAS